MFGEAVVMASNARGGTKAAGVSYIVPLAHRLVEDISELSSYLARIAGTGVEVLVVDGSPAAVFDHHRRLLPASVTHLAPADGLNTPVGKVANVLTGVGHASYDRVVIADEDVRYQPGELAPVVAWLDTHAVVRPQNYFEPAPWHAVWDGARSLLNRSFGGDWPGTLAVSRDALMNAGGYAGDAIFENLEMVRTIRAAGGREKVALDAYVRRLPPTTRHFWSQRVRQAYDEFARPRRMVVFLGILPVLAGLARAHAWGVIAGVRTAGDRPRRSRAPEGRRAPFLPRHREPDGTRLALGARWLCLDRAGVAAVPRRDPVSWRAHPPGRHPGAQAAVGAPRPDCGSPVTALASFRGADTDPRYAYLGPGNDRLLNLDDPDDQAPPLAALVHDPLRALVQSSGFTCLGAKAAFQHGSYRLGLLGELGAVESAAGLAHGLGRFIGERSRWRDGFSSYLGVFTGPTAVDEGRLRRPAVAPAAAAASARRRQLGPVGGLRAGPARLLFQLRWDRVLRRRPPPEQLAVDAPVRLAGAGLQLHDQFERLRAEGSMERMQEVTRARDVELQGRRQPQPEQLRGDAGSTTIFGRRGGGGVEMSVSDLRPTSSHRLPAQSGYALRLVAGQLLKVIDPMGQQVADLTAFNPGDKGEWLSSGRTIDYANTIYMSSGNVLYSTAAAHAHDRGGHRRSPRLPHHPLQP